MGSIRGVSARQVNATPITGHRRPIMVDAAELSTAFAGIRADHASQAACAVRPAVARTTIGRTSGEAARAHAGHAQSLNTAMSGSWLNEHVSISGGARPGRGAGISVGRCRWRRMRSITEASSISAIRRTRPPQLGHIPRPVHEKGTSRSRPQSSQRKRAKPPASIPHRRDSRNSCSMKRGSPQRSRARSASARDLAVAGERSAKSKREPSTLRPRQATERSGSHSS